MSDFSFSQQYDSLRLPRGTDGLRRGQIGAIHASAGHLAIRNSPAVVVMPTGSGKTAVLMTLPYLLDARRVLVVTPSQLVRGQIADEFASLGILRRLGVVPKDAPAPLVRELRGKILTAEAWDSVASADVVVSTPMTISPVLEGIAAPPPDMFDVLLIDEAHHSPAKTWAALLDAFPGAKRALFTATPYRRDRKFIKGEFVFTYPLSEARADGVFGDIRFEPVEPNRGEDADIAIATRVAAALEEDRVSGFKHSILIRADTKNRADELLKKYQAHTSLRLRVVHSGHTAKYAQQTIKKLKAQELDGVIGVNMMGEGFDFPNLKIAALHSPHRSLGVTLQFIGRFARVGDHTIGPARFFAVPKEIEGETAKLFVEDAVWQDLIVNLSEGRVSTEAESRRRISQITLPNISDVTLENLSLHALRPKQHVKVYEVPPGTEPDITAELVLPRPFDTVYRQADETESVAILIGREQQKPAWCDQVQLGRSEYELVIVYYDPHARLLFINSSRHADSLYRELARQYLGRAPKILPLYKINRCLAGLSNIECFSVGMKNRLHTSHTESYRVIAGRNAHAAIRRTDGRLFHRGHIFCRAQDNGTPITLGYSSGSKLWSSSKGDITQLLDWCRTLARKMSVTTGTVIAPGLDILSVGEPLKALPGNVLAVDWDAIVYGDPIGISYSTDGKPRQVELTEASVSVNRDASTPDSLRIVVEYNDESWSFDFAPNRDAFFTEVPTGTTVPEVTYGDDQMSLTDFLNEYPLHFYFADFARLRGEEWFPGGQQPELFDAAQIQAFDWSGADIETEFWHPGKPRTALLSVQEYIERHLSAGSDTVIFYDHRSGEVADYFVVQDTSSRVVITLYHCKGSGGPKPGARIGDVYEVAGQVVKSFNLIANEKEFLAHVRRRAKNGSQFIRGDFDTLQALVRNRGAKALDYQFAVVQPGISKAQLSEDGASVLGAADEFVRSLGALPLVVIASE